MNAKFENVVNKNRQRLEKVLPLETPYSLFVDVCNLCNFKCKFCAIQYSKRRLNFKKQMMEYSLFQKVIDNLAEFSEPLKMLRLAANGEPLLNRDLPKMIDYAKRKNIAQHIEIVTNGSLLNPILNRQLVEAGLDRIRISIEAIDTVGYHQMAGITLDWNNFIENIQDFYECRKKCEVYIKTVDAAVDTDQKKEMFLKIFGDMCDHISIENVIPIWVDYEEICEEFSIQNEGLHGHKVRDVQICPFPFYSFVVNPDGQVTACCSDWERHILLGDVTNQSLYEIWHGKKYKEFLKGMLEKGRKSNHKCCSLCVYPCYDSVDNIDDFSQDLLRKYMD